MNSNDESTNSLQQSFISMSCSTIYGEGAWPYQILFGCYLVIGILSFHRFVTDFTINRFKKNQTKYLALGFLCILCIYKAAFYVIPFPLKISTTILFCNTIPKNLSLFSWNFLGIFFVYAFLLQNVSKNFVRGLYIFFITLMTLLVIVSVTLGCVQV